MWSTLLARTCSLANPYSDKIDLAFRKMQMGFKNLALQCQHSTTMTGFPMLNRALSYCLRSLDRSSIAFLFPVSLPARLSFSFFLSFYLSSICYFVRDYVRTKKSIQAV